MTRDDKPEFTLEGTPAEDMEVWANKTVPQATKLFITFKAVDAMDGDDFKEARYYVAGFQTAIALVLGMTANQKAESETGVLTAMLKGYEMADAMEAKLEEE